MHTNPTTATPTPDATDLLADVARIARRVAGQPDEVGAELTFHLRWSLGEADPEAEALATAAQLDAVIAASDHLPYSERARVLAALRDLADGLERTASGYVCDDCRAEDGAAA